MGLPGLLDAVNAGTAPKPGDHSVFVCPAAKASTRAAPYFLPYAMNMYLSTWNAHDGAKPRGDRQSGRARFHG